MKSTKYLILFILALTLTVPSCKKDETTLSKKKILIAKSWQLSSIKENGVTDVLHDCDKDNILTFLLDGTYSFDPNVIKCDLGSKIESGTWSLSSDEKFLLLDDGTQMTIVELSEIKLVLLEVGNVNSYEMTLVSISSKSAK